MPKAKHGAWRYANGILLRVAGVGMIFHKTPKTSLPTPKACLQSAAERFNEPSHPCPNC